MCRGGCGSTCCVKGAARFHIEHGMGKRLEVTKRHAEGGWIQQWADELRHVGKQGTSDDVVWVDREAWCV